MLLVGISALALNAQKNVDARIQEIREAYASRLAKMENQPYDSLKVEQMTIEYNRIYPGTGLFTSSTTYYWTDDENEDYMLKPTLYFVTERRTMNHGMYRYANEYLFDAETEEPMFLFITNALDGDTARWEYRFYFDKGQLIKQIPERIGPFDEDALMTPGFRVDDNGKANVTDLNSYFEEVKTRFHDIMPTYGW